MFFKKSASFPPPPLSLSLNGQRPVTNQERVHRTRALVVERPTNHP